MVAGRTRNGEWEFQGTLSRGEIKRYESFN